MKKLPDSVLLLNVKIKPCPKAVASGVYAAAKAALDSAMEAEESAWDVEQEALVIWNAARQETKKRLVGARAERAELEEFSVAHSEEYWAWRKLRQTRAIALKASAVRRRAQEEVMQHERSYQA